MVASDDPIRKYEPLWGNWQVTELLGEGSYGRVYRVVRHDGGYYESAVKLISIPRSEIDIQEARQMGLNRESMYAYFAETAERIVKEIDIMHSLKGEANIVSYEDHQIFHEEGTLKWDILIRMELLIPLESYISGAQCETDEVRRLGIEICSALEACSAYGVIHRDIKEANIFLNPRGAFKLGDFGIAREMAVSGSMSMSMRGTPAYIAPEVYNGRRYDERADIYSLGILMYKMLNSGRYPFLPSTPAPITLDDAERAFSRRIKGDPPSPPSHGDSALRAAVMRAVSFDPHSRFQTASDFKQALLSPSAATPGKGVNRKLNVTSPEKSMSEAQVDRCVQETIYSAYADRPNSKAPEAASEPVKSGKTTKTVIAFAAATLAVLALVLAFVLTLPGAENPKVGSDTPVMSTDRRVDPNDTVSWTDPAMSQLLSVALEKTPETITYRDLAEIQELYINGDDATLSHDEYSAWHRAYYNGGVGTLRDLQYCTNLKTLIIYDQTQDSLKPLSALTNLKELRLVDCNRPDLLPFDLSPLASMTQLESLSLREDNVKDISVLAPLVNLETLDVSSTTFVYDISIVSNMTKLKELSASDIGITAIPDLSRLNELTYLNLRDCKLTDISGLEGNTSLQWLTLDRNQIDSLAGIEGLTQLEELKLSGNKISSVEPLASLDSITWLELNDNDISDLSPLLDMDALKWLYVTYNDSTQDNITVLIKKGVDVITS